MQNGNVVQPIQWSSEYFDDELGLSYYNYRYYSSEMGRWLEKDPYEETALLNLYSYVKNSFVFKKDILGLIPDDYMVGKAIGLSSSTSKHDKQQTSDIYSGVRTEPTHSQNETSSISQDDAQMVLDILGIFDPTPTCDGVNAIVYAINQDWINMSISLAGFIPLVGDLAKFKRFCKKGLAANPFVGKNLEMLDEYFQKKGFIRVGNDPKKGEGSYIHPVSKKAYHIDPQNFYNEPPHIDVSWTAKHPQKAAREKEGLSTKRKYYGIDYPPNPKNGKGEGE